MERIKLREYQLLIEKRKWVSNSDHLPKQQIITAIAHLPSDVFRNILNLEEREKYYVKDFKILREFEVVD
jgi:hypothetical protein